MILIIIYCAFGVLTFLFLRSTEDTIPLIVFPLVWPLWLVVFVGTLTINRIIDKRRIVKARDRRI